MSRLVVLSVLATAACIRDPHPKHPLVTVGERSGYARTGDYAEAEALCHEFAIHYGGVRCDEIGATLEGRPIVAIHVSRGEGHPTIYFQGGIHSGEIDGKDAGFWFLRDLLDGKVAPGALDVVDLVFAPVINPDGHERSTPNNRPNQRGPEEMGFRTNAVRQNLNRDFMKVDTNEIRAVLGVVAKYDPVVFVDLHVTDGAKFEHDVAVLDSPAEVPRGDRLDETAQALSDQIQARMTALGHLPLQFYPSFEQDDEPTSGFAVGEAPPRFSQGYMGTRSRLGILVETHSWRPYKHRVETTYHFLQTLFEQATKDARTWAAVEKEADVADRALRDTQLPLVYGNTDHVTMIDFRGYVYEQKPSDISGGTWITYDESRPQIWKVPLEDEVTPKVTVRVPHVGYIIDGGYAALLEPVLKAHGIETHVFTSKPAKVEVFRATSVKFEPPFEGRTRVSLEGGWSKETRTPELGAILVPLDQPKARLIVHLLDPAGPDSFAQWGFLNTVFERKEYMESYVAEEAARAMLAKDPALRAQFDAAVAADPELAKSPAKRLDWFYKRHPAWDERTNLLPIYRYDG
jgi:hypothetical protein